jgi:hypothetical protein
LAALLLALAISNLSQALLLKNLVAVAVPIAQHPTIPRVADAVPNAAIAAMMMIAHRRLFLRFSSDLLR